MVNSTAFKTANDSMTIHIALTTLKCQNERKEFFRSVI